MIADILVFERLDIFSLSGLCRHGEGPVERRLRDGWRGSRGRLRRHRFQSNCPADAAHDQVLKTRIAPSALIVTPGGVKDTSLALGADPCPGFFAFAVLAIFQNRAVLVIVLGMHITFVPALEAFEPFHDGVVWLRNGRTKDAGTMAFELGTDERDIFRRVLKGERGTVQRDKTLAAFDIIEQVFFLFGSDFGGVRINDKPVIFGERFRIDGVDRGREVDCDATSRHRWFKLLETGFRRVSALVPKEENADWAGLLSGNKSRQRCNNNKGANKIEHEGSPIQVSMAISEQKKLTVQGAESTR